MKIYISGKITGYKQKPLKIKNRKHLLEKGFEPVNPFNFGNPPR